MRKLNITIILGVILALVGAGLAFLYGHNVDQRIARGQRTERVVVARTTLASLQSPAALSASVTMTDIPTAYLPQGALTSLSQVGSSELLLGPVPQGTVLSAGMFGNPSTATAVKPPVGMIDLAFETGLTPGLLHYVGPGSHVDMFVTVPGAAALCGRPAAPAASGSAAAAAVAASCTKLFASDVKVVSVTPATAAQQAGTATAAAAQSSAPVATVADVICVVEVTPALGEMIVNATASGAIYLGLTNAGDVHRTNGTVTTEDLTANK